MRILVVGGTGLISSAFSAHCLARGDDLTLITRGTSTTSPVPRGAKAIHVDATDAAALRSALHGPRLRGERWDAVIQFVAFTPAHVSADVETFAPLTDRYVLISSASAYRSFDHFVALTEDTELRNPFWGYSRDKIACEAALIRHAVTTGLPYTIVRPSHTYGASKIPAFTGNSRHPWTIIDRMRRGKDIVIPGDGTALWTVTHASDVAAGMRGLLDTKRSLGLEVHITSDVALTWTGLYSTIARAAGLSPEQFASQVVYVPSEALIAAAPTQEGSIRGDKMHSAVFDNSLIKDLVPGWEAKVPFARGIEESIAAFEAHPEWRLVDDEANAMFDRLAAIYRAALSSAAMG